MARRALRCFFGSLNWCFPIRSSSGIDKAEMDEDKDKRVTGAGAVTRGSGAQRSMQLARKHACKEHNDVLWLRDDAVDITCTTSTRRLHCSLLAARGSVTHAHSLHHASRSRSKAYNPTILLGLDTISTRSCSNLTSKAQDELRFHWFIGTRSSFLNSPAIATPHTTPLIFAKK